MVKAYADSREGNEDEKAATGKPGKKSPAGIAIVSDWFGEGDPPSVPDETGNDEKSSFPTNEQWFAIIERSRASDQAEMSPQHSPFADIPSPSVQRRPILKPERSFEAARSPGAPELKKIRGRLPAFERSRIRLKKLETEIRKTQFRIDQSFGEEQAALEQHRDKLEQKSIGLRLMKAWWNASYNRYHHATRLAHLQAARRALQEGKPIGEVQQHSIGLQILLGQEKARRSSAYDEICLSRIIAEFHRLMFLRDQDGSWRDDSDGNLEWQPDVSPHRINKILEHLELLNRLPSAPKRRERRFEPEEEGGAWREVSNGEYAPVPDLSRKDVGELIEEQIGTCEQALEIWERNLLAAGLAIEHHQNSITTRNWKTLLVATMAQYLMQRKIIRPGGAPDFATLMDEAARWQKASGMTGSSDWMRETPDERSEREQRNRILRAWDEIYEKADTETRQKMDVSVKADGWAAYSNAVRSDTGQEPVSRSSGSMTPELPADVNPGMQRASAGQDVPGPIATDTFNDFLADGTAQAILPVDQPCSGDAGVSALHAASSGVPDFIYNKLVSVGMPLLTFYLNSRIGRYASVAQTENINLGDDDGAASAIRPSATAAFRLGGFMLSAIAAAAAGSVYGVWHVFSSASAADGPTDEHIEAEVRHQEYLAYAIDALLPSPAPDEWGVLFHDGGGDGSRAPEMMPGHGGETVARTLARRRRSAQEPHRIADDTFALTGARQQLAFTSIPLQTGTHIRLPALETSVIDYRFVLLFVLLDAGHTVACNDALSRFEIMDKDTGRVAYFFLEGDVQACARMTEILKDEIRFHPVVARHKTFAQRTDYDAVINRCRSVHGAWSAIEAGGNIVDQLTGAVHDIPPYAAAIVATAPSASFTVMRFSEAVANDHLNQLKLDLMLLLTAGYRISFVEDAGNAEAFLNQPDREILSTQPFELLQISGRTNKYLLVTATSQATVDHIAGGVYKQLRESGQQTRASESGSWTPPKLGIPDNVLTPDDLSLFRLMNVEQKGDAEFTPMSADDIVGDNMAMAFFASRGNLTLSALRFISSVPVLEKEVAERAERFMMDRWGAVVEAENTYVIFFDVSPAEAKKTADFAFPAEKIRKKIRLDNFFIENYPSGPDYQYSASMQPGARYSVGLFVDKGGMHSYGRSDRVATRDGGPVSFRDFDREFGKLNIQAEQTARIEAFMTAEKKQEYASLQASQYTYALLNEAESLGKESFDLASQVLVPAAEQDATLRIETIDINGRIASHAFIIYRSTGGRVILYMPPTTHLEESSFVVYKDMDSMKLGMIYRATDARGRESISGHPATAETPQDLKERFAAEDRLSSPTIFGTSGTDDVIDDLGRFFRRGKVKVHGKLVWTADADAKMSGTAEINKKSSTERDIKAAPFLALADLLKHSILSEAKVGIVTTSELSRQRAGKAVSDLSTVVGIFSLIMFPFVSFSALIRAALVRSVLAAGGTAASTGLERALNADTPKERMEGWLLAIGGGVDIAFGGLPIPRFKVLKKTGLSAGRHARLVKDFGKEKINRLMKSLGVDPDVPVVFRGTRLTDDVAEALFRISHRLKEGGAAFRAQVQKLLTKFRTNADLVQHADIAAEAKMARLTVIARQSQKEFDDLFEQEFIRIDLPEDAIGNADDLVSRIKEEVHRTEEGLNELSGSLPRIGNEELLAQKKAAQQSVNDFSDDVLHPELYVSDTSNYLKEFSDPGISRNMVTIADDGTFTHRGQRYIFVDDVAVRISMIRPGTREAVLQGRATDAPTVMRMNSGEWRMTSKPGLPGGAPEIHIGLDSPQLHKMQFEGQTTYQLKLPGEDEFTDVRFDLTRLRWVEMNRHGYVLEGGREFEFVANGWVTHQPGSKLSGVTKKKQDDALRQLGFSGMPDIPRYPAKKLLSFPEKIPNMIHHIWIGTGAISAKNINLLKQTIDMAKQSSPAFDVKLHLGITNAANRAETMERLQPLIRNGGFEVIDLYSSQFFLDFKKSELFGIYQAFAEGSDINYAGAVDALRYELANYYGGFYKDMDDEMVGALNNIKLTKGDVIVPSPRVNPHLGMFFDYNNSLFGTLKGNPTLTKLSEEALQQFKQNPDAFKNRPRANKDSTPAEKNRVYEYEQRVSQFVGPHRLSKVISEQIPERGKYLAWSKIKGGGSVELSGKLKEKLAEADKDFALLDDLFVIKSDESWIESR